MLPSQSDHRANVNSGGRIGRTRGLSVRGACANPTSMTNISRTRDYGDCSPFLEYAGPAMLQDTDFAITSNSSLQVPQDGVNDMRIDLTGPYYLRASAATAAVHGPGSPPIHSYPSHQNGFYHPSPLRNYGSSSGASGTWNQGDASTSAGDWYGPSNGVVPPSATVDPSYVMSQNAHYNLEDIASPQHYRAPGQLQSSWTRPAGDISSAQDTSSYGLFAPPPLALPFDSSRISDQIRDPQASTSYPALSRGGQRGTQDGSQTHAVPRMLPMPTYAPVNALPAEYDTGHTPYAIDYGSWFMPQASTGSGLLIAPSQPPNPAQMPLQVLGDGAAPAIPWFCLWMVNEGDGERCCDTLLQDVGAAGITRHLRDHHFQGGWGAKNRGMCKWEGCTRDQEMDFASFGKHVTGVHLKGANVTSRLCSCGTLCARPDALIRHKKRRKCA